MFDFCNIWASAGPLKAERIERFACGPSVGPTSCPLGVCKAPRSSMKTRQDTMRRTLVPRFPPALELSATNDVGLHALASDIALAAKTSGLVAASPAMQASVAAIATMDAALDTDNQLVADDRAKLRIDIA